ncbi:hypothetical protein RchiOBHm_Chr6g0271611 [Rosa chinensis]|uniref:Uncharacterized protein n=1 Tax=Rosa chinensis TaxID=74649 RepID=A0A2P6PR21_ROSCH|nr:hypothetical protein RchiOBHm_Chr6g0271611 [Rosa chinensis]
MTSLFLDKDVGIAELGVRKRKRGRKPKVKGPAGSSGEVLGLQIVNKNGAAVDIWALQNSENPFGDELRRRTLGLETEEELLGFMRELGGQWGSRRKKRKIVDATEFGDALLGWKLLLGQRNDVLGFTAADTLALLDNNFCPARKLLLFWSPSLVLIMLKGKMDLCSCLVFYTLDNKYSSISFIWVQQYADKDGERRQDVSSSSAILVSAISK